MTSQYDLSIDSFVTFTKRMVSKEYEQQYQKKQTYLNHVRHQYFHGLYSKLNILIVPEFPLTTSFLNKKNEQDDLYVKKHISHWKTCDIVASIIVNYPLSVTSSKDEEGNNKQNHQHNNKYKNPNIKFYNDILNVIDNNNNTNRNRDEVVVNYFDHINNVFHINHHNGDHNNNITIRFNTNMNNNKNDNNMDILNYFKTNHLFKTKNVDNNDDIEQNPIFVVNLKTLYSCNALEFAYRKFMKYKDHSIVGFHGIVLTEENIQKQSQSSYYSPYPYNSIALTKGAIVSNTFFNRLFMSLSSTKKYNKLHKVLQNINGIGIDSFFSFVHNIEFKDSIAQMVCLGWMDSCYNFYDDDHNSYNNNDNKNIVMSADETTARKKQHSQDDHSTATTTTTTNHHHVAFLIHQLFKTFGNPFNDGIKKGGHNVNWIPQTYKYVITPNGINDYRKDKNKPLSSSSINDKFPLCYSMPVKDINTKSSCNKQKFAV